MGLAADAYQRMQMALLPPGKLLRRLTSSLLSSIFLGAGDELARLDARISNLRDEAVPSLAVELLADYESELALASDGTTAQRQARIVARLVARQRYRPVDFQNALAPILGQAPASVAVLERICSAMKNVTGDWNMEGSVGASTITSFAGDGYMQWSAVGTFGDGNWYLLGLSHSDVTTLYSGVQYGWMLRQDTGHAVVYENGALVFDTGAGWSAGDVFRVERIGSTVYYKKNGTLAYTSAVASTGSLVIDSAFLATSGAVTGIRMFDAGVERQLEWQNVHGLTVERFPGLDFASDGREIFRWFVYRNPSLPGMYSIADAQALINAIEPAHTHGVAIESVNFPYDDPHSFYDRDLRGA